MPQGSLQYIHWTKLKRWIRDENFFPHPEEEYELLFNYLEEKFKRTTAQKNNK